VASVEDGQLGLDLLTFAVELGEPGTDPGHVRAADGPQAELRILCPEQAGGQVARQLAMRGAGHRRSGPFRSWRVNMASRRRVGAWCWLTGMNPARPD